MTEPTPPPLRLARAVHDIRAPVHTVLAVSELLTHTNLDETQRRYIESLQSAAGMLIRLVDDLLELSRDAPLSLRREPFSIRAVMEQVADVVAPRAHAQGLAVAAIVDPDVPAIVVGDGPRVAQVLTNLASNAVKYTARGEVAIRARRGDRSNVYRFEVEDTGPGIPEDQRERIFEPYAQIDPGGQAGGVGLGLAICRELCERLGGRIHLDSVVGRGSIFSFEVELTESSDPRPRAPSSLDLRHLRFAFIGCARTTAQSLAAILAPWSPRIDAHDTDSPAARAALAAADVAILDGSDAWNAHGAALRPATHVLVLRDAGEAAPPDCASLMKPVHAHELLQQLSRLLLRRNRTLVSQGVSVAADLSGLRLLVVDDTRANLEYARLVLSALGAHIDTESDGSRVADRIAADPSYSALLLDLEMPVFSGYEVLARVREAEARRDDAGSPLPIIVLSAHTGGETIERAFRLGATSYLEKPATRDDLASVVATYARRVAAPAKPAPAGAALSGDVRQRLLEVQMALLRRDFRAVALSLDAVADAGVDTAGLDAALRGKDLAALQRAVNALLQSGAAPSAAAALDATARPRALPTPLPTDTDLAAILTTGLRAEFNVSARELWDDVHALRPPLSPVDRERLRNAAHRIAGSAALFGFAELGERARLLERQLVAVPVVEEDLRAAVDAFLALLRGPAGAAPSS